MRAVLTCVFVLYCTMIFAQGLTGIDGLMPIPKEVTATEEIFVLDKDFDISISGDSDERIYGAATRFLRILDNRTGLFFKQGIVSPTNSAGSANLKITVVRKGKVELYEDESYELTVSSNQILLECQTDIGAIRGLQTLQQLLSNDSDRYFFQGAKIKDEPRMAWRGLMIDASRHFMPMEVIMRNLDGMEAVKLNVLHLHLCDDHGYRLESEAYPKLNTHASDGQFYTHEQVGEIVRYAADRGIRVMPEIDVPGHGSAILTAYPELGSKDMEYSLARISGIFDPTLDPTKDQTYEFLENLFTEVAGLFPDAYFHIGGDENEGKHWDENKNIQQFMKKNKIVDNHHLQSYFNNKLLVILNKLDKKMVGWEEIQTSTMSKDAIIHIWKALVEGEQEGGSLTKAIKEGFRSIVSQGYYIDLMKPAEAHYLSDSLFKNADLSDDEQKRFLGAETTMWSELVTPETVDSRIWPRTAAIAERYWSDVSVRNVRDMYRRLDKIDPLLENYGLTHIKNKEFFLRRLSNGQDVEPLRTLVDVIEPMKGYTRNPGGELYTVFSPYTLLADVATADAKDALKFRFLVEDYISGKDSSKGVMDFLNKWKSNHARLLKVIDNSPVLKDAALLSTNLKLVSEVGLKAQNYIETGTKPSEDWLKNSAKILEQAKQQSGRTELQVIGPIEKLILHSTN